MQKNRWGGKKFGGKLCWKRHSIGEECIMIIGMLLTPNVNAKEVFNVASGKSLLESSRSPRINDLQGWSWRKTLALFWNKGWKRSSLTKICKLFSPWKCSSSRLLHETWRRRRRNVKKCDSLVSSKFDVAALTGGILGKKWAFTPRSFH